MQWQKTTTIQQSTKPLKRRVTRVRTIMAIYLIKNVTYEEIERDCGHY